MSEIRNMSRDEILSRTGRFSGLQPMSTAKALEGKVPHVVKASQLVLPKAK